MAPKKKPINKKPERPDRNKQTKLEVLAEDLEKLDLENKLREEEEDSDEEEEIVVSRVEAKKVDYCAECSFPIEYCEFSDKWPLCEKWLETRFPEKLKELIELREGDKNKNKKIDKKVAREVKEIVEGTEEKRVATKSNRELLIRIDKRSKRKRLTLITGIEAFMEDAFRGDEKFFKDVVKIFGKKFACGCSIVKKPELSIEIQGNVPGKVAKYFTKELGVDINQIYVLEDKKKTKASDYVFDSDEEEDDSDE
ncbi:predicted protein [Naegleria gruberi]|uniref:Predicted protein n=1 Tax=Naegleria gruberi TaxID=5762 RepID=D2W0R1_NAEGR|nr:uncharacterized protein NAEGRDRAFT_81951 [Naegleria gruberi]EFC37336.1 predicted protein [Naegleria gruberi]|eukprot:XP_002670080.1 predicted protein [Naegleria gruberi strain NEG-M]